MEGTRNGGGKRRRRRMEADGREWKNGGKVSVRRSGLVPNGILTCRVRIAFNAGNIEEAGRMVEGSKWMSYRGRGRENLRKNSGSHTGARTTIWGRRGRWNDSILRLLGAERTQECVQGRISSQMYRDWTRGSGGLELEDATARTTVAMGMTAELDGGTKRRDLDALGAAASTGTQNHRKMIWKATALRNSTARTTTACNTARKTRGKLWATILGRGCVATARGTRGEGRHH
ncbi:hypothetical protein C8R46DRAFT_1202109 [Mycena filopes]|nr:hypothetical protein C8R46DRAFT_1202109 [Mycena filopes]